MAAGTTFEFPIPFTPTQSSGPMFDFVVNSPSSSSGPMFDHVVDTIPTQSSGPMFDHDVSALELPGIRGPQVGQSEITFNRMVDTTSHALASNVNVTLTATGTTALYTASQKTYILGIVLRVITANTVTVLPQVSVGVNPITDDIFANETLVNFDTVNDLYHFWGDLNTARVLNATDQLDLVVNTAATASALVAVVYVVGIAL